MEETNTSSKKQRRSFGGGSSSSLARRSIGFGGGGGGKSLMSSAVGGFGGFATAWEVKDTLAAQQQKENHDAQKPAAAATAANNNGFDDQPRQNNNSSSNGTDAEAAPLDDNLLPSLAASQYAALPLAQPVSLTLTLRGTQFHMDDVGDNSTFYKLLKKGCQELKLEREPDNEYDGMAIRVGYYIGAKEVGGEGGEQEANAKADCHDEMEAEGAKGEGTEKKDGNHGVIGDGVVESSNNNNAQQIQTIGHIAKEQAKVLSPYFDAGCLRLDTVVVTG